MKLFKGFEKKAQKTLEKFQNPDEDYNRKKFKSLEKVNDYGTTPEFEDQLDEDLGELPKEYPENEYDDYSNLQPSQKPESFHFFILENQYRDLERMIRGVKDVFDKEKNEWRIKKKDVHCFTDEEAEDIVRTAQSHLSPDIKLAYFSKEEYPIMMRGLFQQIFTLFRTIMEYRFGRFKDGTEQAKMKLQAVNIFHALMMRIKANYSRAIQGSENKATHQSVKGQESLNQPHQKGYDEGYT